MKIRNGFVSNSSSSAFVIKIKDLTIDQLDKITKFFAVKAIDGEIRAKFSKNVINPSIILDGWGIPSGVIRWTNLE